MDLFEGMDVSRKIALLEQAKEALTSELIPSLLRVGINPATFDPTYASEHLENIEQADQFRLLKLCEGFVLANETIAALS